MDIKQLLLSLLTGAVLWGVFTLLKLPLPAPGALAGIVGIIWIYLWYVLVNYFIK
jgi:XapX domain-containing protein